MKQFENLCELLGISVEQAKENDITVEQLKDILRVRIELSN
jgi:hypothetical protein